MVEPQPDAPWSSFVVVFLAMALNLLVLLFVVPRVQHTLDLNDPYRTLPALTVFLFLHRNAMAVTAAASTLLCAIATERGSRHAILLCHLALLGSFLQVTLVVYTLFTTMAAMD